MNLCTSTPHPLRKFRIIAVFIVAAACGCAQLREAATELENVSAARQDRKQQVVEDFEQRRDVTQYRASLACCSAKTIAAWAAMDIASSYSRLENASGSLM